MGSCWLSIEPDHSTIGLLGKLFFRRQPSWAQRRKMIVLLCSILAGLFCGGVVVVIILATKSH
jgi:hypothetical protein